MNKSMTELISWLSPLKMAPNSPDTDECIRRLCEELPFDVEEFDAGLEVNGWIVPKHWYTKNATIHGPDGELVYDGLWHPMAVIGYSRSFKGEIDLQELKQHLFFSDVFDDALIYHCDLFYKPFREEWGFSMPKQQIDALKPGLYSIDLQTAFEDKPMKVAEYILPGETEESIVINAHNCHAFCCNDDLSGIAIGIACMRLLAQIPKRRFTYRLVVAPEHYGSIFYLDARGPEKTSSIKWGIFLESLGTNQPIALQRSFTGISMIDRVLKNVFEYGEVTWRTEPFRKVVGNDETCWEAVGYEIPFPSLSRMPFPEYHTSRDAPGLMRESRLAEARDVVMEALWILEHDAVVERKFTGLVALSHPRFDLYQPMLDPSEPGRRTISDMQRRWNYLMDCLPRYFDGQTRLIEIAERHELPFRAVYDYVQAFVDKGLAVMHPASADNPPLRKLPPQ